MTRSPLSEEDAGRAVTWDRSLNRTAYQEVEAESNYATPNALEKYRTLLLAKSAPAAAFIKKTVVKSDKLNVLEFCSGSGRLLYALNRLGILEAGVGVEVSQSRHRFAEKWRQALGTGNVANFHGLANDYEFDQAMLDLVVMIDGALSYIYPTDPSFPENLLRRIHRKLVAGGRVVLEFAALSDDQRHAIERNGDFRSWSRGDDKDAFAYALYRTEIVSWSHMVVQNSSTYLPRDGGAEKVKLEHYKYYDVAELDALFGRTGFHAVYYGGFDFEPHTAHSDTIIAVATKV